MKTCHQNIVCSIRLHAATVLGAMGLALANLLPVHAALSTSMTLTSDTNPVVITKTTTLTANLVSALGNLDVRFPIGFGSSSGQGKYIRYDLINASFANTVTSNQLSDATTAGNFGGATLVSAGGAGSTYAVFQIAAGASGIPSSDTVSFLIPLVVVNFANTTPSIRYSLHESAVSVIGDNPTNSTLLVQASASLPSFTTSGPITGTMNFMDGGVSIAGCGAVSVVSGSAQCVASFTTGGAHTITANYSGAVNYAASSGSLANAQTVLLAIAPTILPSSFYGFDYSATLNAIGSSSAQTYTMTFGALPPGIVLSPSGVFSGKPTAAGAYDFVINVMDANGASGSQQFSITVFQVGQTINFFLPGSGNAATSFTLNGTASSGLTVYYTLATPLTCKLDGTTLRLLAPGSCTVLAIQVGNQNYAAATTLTRSMAVLPARGNHQILLRAAIGQSLVGNWVNNQFQFVTQVDPGANFRTVAALDLDGNGTIDLVFQDITQGALGDVHTWRDFLPVNDRILRSVKRVWDVQAVGDLDGDGYGDLVWRYTLGGTAESGVSYIWFTNGTAVTQVRKRGAAPLDWTLLGAVDLNGDNAADMIYVSPTNQIRALMATPGRTCANLSAGNIPTGFVAIRVADFTGRTSGDILIRHNQTGDTRLLSLDANGLALPQSTASPDDANASCTASSLTVANKEVVLPLTPVSWQFYAAADYNGDGIVDITWRQPDGTLTVWLMNRDGAAPTVISNAGSAPAGYAVLFP